MQERCNSIANALELYLSCTNPSRYSVVWYVLHQVQWNTACFIIGNWTVWYRNVSCISFNMCVYLWFLIDMKGKEGSFFSYSLLNLSSKKFAFMIWYIKLFHLIQEKWWEKALGVCNISFSLWFILLMTLCPKLDVSGNYFHFSGVSI